MILRKKEKMKTRSKIITIIAISVIGFLFIPVYVTHTYCDLFEPENGGCMRISGIGTGELTFNPLCSYIFI